MKNLDKLMKYTNINNIVCYELGEDNDIIAVTFGLNIYGPPKWEKTYLLSHHVNLPKIIKNLLFSNNINQIQLALNLI